MSATTTLGAPNTVGTPTTTTDRVIGAARDLPDMISKASAFDPDLASKWTGKSLLASKTVWGTAIALLLTAVVKRYTLGWDQNTVDIVAGAIDLGIVAAFRSISDTPITGWFHKATTAEAIVKATTTTTTQGPTP